MTSILPPSKPKLAPDLVMAALENNLQRFLTLQQVGSLKAACPVMVLANRAYYLDTMGKRGVNDCNVYDDAAWLIDLRTAEVLPFNWNCDPARIGWNPGVGKPFAQLNEGVWPFMKGPHKGKGPAWRQPDEEQAVALKLTAVFAPSEPQAAGNFVVTRTYTDAKGQTHSYQDAGYHAINIHWGGEAVTSSWGCQTCPPTEAQWYAFQERSYELTKASGQRWLPYVLTDETVA